MSLSVCSTGITYIGYEIGFVPIEQNHTALNRHVPEFHFCLCPYIYIQGGPKNVYTLYSSISLE